MVKKLIKFEFIAWFRTMLPMLLILLGISGLTRIVQLFETETATYSIVNTSSIVALCISILVCSVMCVAVGVTRFYKNLFTNEGYLTLSLPVSYAGQIFAKLITAVAFTAITAVGIIVSINIATLGDVSHELCKAFGYLVKKYFGYLGVNGAFYVLEVIIMVIAIEAKSFLLLYACISIGQLAKKNRVLAAFGTFFAYYFICQILGTVFIIVSETVGTGLWDWIDAFFCKHYYTAMHLLFCGIILFEVIMGAVYYLISYTVMRKKLNIE